MVFIDWTFSGVGTGTLDPAVKYAGTSSYKAYMSGTQGTSALTHDTFSEPRATVIAWVRVHYQSTINTKTIINHSSYGDLQMYVSAIDTWEKLKVMFWYDIESNTKFGRVYKWSGTDWTQYGTDTNFGAGSPAAGSIALKVWSNLNDAEAWFDEVEIYS